MRFALIAYDKVDSLNIRLENRDAHLAYVAKSGVVEMAGPFLNTEGNMCGSLLILTLDSIAKARDWAENDPYAKAGLFETVSIQEWKKVIGS
ncbi:YciI family protein [Profundibacter sp.]